MSDKKKASQAMTNLRSYMSRYEPGLSWLEAVHRYNGELRRKCAAMQEEIEKQQSTIQELKKRANDCAADNDKLQAEKDRLSDVVRQQNKDLLSERQNIEKLKAFYEGEDVKGDAVLDRSEVVGLIRKMKQRWHNAPPRYNRRINTSDIDYAFSIDEILKGRAGDDYMYLGMLVHFVVLFSGKFAAVLDGGAVVHELSDKEKAVVAKYIMRSWFADTPTDAELKIKSGW